MQDGVRKGWGGGGRGLESRGGRRGSREGHTLYLRAKEA